MTAMVYYRSNYPDVNPPFTSNTSGGARVHVALQGTSDIALGTAFTSYTETFAQPLPSNFRIVSGKTTESRSLLGIIATPLLVEQRAYPGSWVTTRQDWTAYANAIWPSVVQRRTDASGSLWDIASNTWTGGRLTKTVDETGLTQNFTYDSAGRMLSVTRVGATSGSAAISDQTFTMSYDAAGRLLSRTTTAGTESMATSASYGAKRARTRLDVLQL